MYAEFLSGLLTYIQALNGADQSIIGDDSLVPYLGSVPVLLDDYLAGFLVDEAGGAWTYRESTEDDRAWWEQRPWRRH